jgi:tetratricopeptide (TPR) repeat protein
MLRNYWCTVCGLTLAAAWLWAGPLSAQDPVFSQFYGSGVHSYYQRDYQEAMDSLSMAIDGGTKDPRAYYYRGLANMRLGNTATARADMQKGAQLESADVDQFYPVGKSLERVQGSERMQLERYRALARAQARRQQLKRDTARYEQRRRAEAQVLRSVPVGPPPAPLRPPGPAPVAAVEPAAPAATPAAAPSAQPPSAQAPAAPTPFDQPTEQPAAASPFDQPAVKKPAEKKPADKQPAAKPGDANPFDTPGAKKPADAAADDNPFKPE